MNKKLFPILLILFLLIAGCTQALLDDSPDYVEPVYATIKVVDQNGETFFYEEAEVVVGTNAFEVMKETLGSSLKYKEYDFGVFIEEIANKPAPEGYFYKLYVDGEESALGIAEYTINENIIIEWRIESFENY